jgi:hypothetical protein
VTRHLERVALVVDDEDTNAVEARCVDGEPRRERMRMDAALLFGLRVDDRER